MRFLGLRLAAVLVVATAMGQASDKNGGPLNRVKRMLQGDTTTTAATAKAFISDHEIQDSWATDPILKSAKRLMNGDHANLVVDMSLGNEVKEIFSDPDTTYAMLQGKTEGETVLMEQMKRQRPVARHSAFSPFPCARPPFLPLPSSSCSHTLVQCVTRREGLESQGQRGLHENRCTYYKRKRF